MESKPANNLSFQAELKRLLPEPKVLGGWLALSVVFLWFYWSSLQHLVLSWYREEDYQHGFVVPIFALVLLWIRRDLIPPAGSRGSLWGLAFLALWAVMRWTAVYFNYGSIPELSMVPFFAGVALFVGGWQGLLWAWPSIIFLLFMIPLPGVVQGLASENLQSGATRLSTFVIQTFGIAAVAQGNVIQLAERPLEVARACSGLRMMMLFFALCIGAAFIVRRPLWERLLMIASAAPIAVAANIARIVLTAVLYELATVWPSVIDLEQYGEAIHNWAGYLMMPIGLLLLLAEMSLLNKLLIEPMDHALVVAPKPGRRAVPVAAGRSVPAKPPAPPLPGTPVVKRPAPTVTGQGATERVLHRRRR
jgi:exosortase